MLEARWSPAGTMRRSRSTDLGLVKSAIFISDFAKSDTVHYIFLYLHVLLSTMQASKTISLVGS